MVQVGDVPDLPLGILDPDLIRWAQSREYVIVSHDINTLPNHLTAHLAGGGASPGIFIVREPLNFALAEWLVLLAVASEPDEWRNRVAYVP